MQFTVAGEHALSGFCIGVKQELHVDASDVQEPTSGRLPSICPMTSGLPDELSGVGLVASGFGVPLSFPGLVASCFGALRSAPLSKTPGLGLGFAESLLHAISADAERARAIVSG
jgi:hypothetical protein